MPPPVTTLVDLLRRQALAQGARTAYAQWLAEGQPGATIGFAALLLQAERVAHGLRSRSAPGDRVLVISPNGLDFVAGLFGCLIAGLVAVPVMAPRRVAGRDSTLAIAEDCGARLALLPELGGEAAAAFEALGIACLSVDAAVGDPAGADPWPLVRAEDVAILQYTSGSTSLPKGVAVSHANLLANLEMMRVALQTGASSTHVCWLPLHHDMGLILNVLHTLYVGATCVLMAPTAFMHRPLGWLRAIHHHRAQVASAPNFALDLCCDRLRAADMEGIDLGCWQVACIGAEPVRAATLDRFAATFAPHGFTAETLLPGYGLAEASVYVSTPGRGRGARSFPASVSGLATGRMSPPVDAADTRRLVGCGWAVPPGELAIARPSGERAADGEVGEIWVRGPHVARGYWQRPEATAAVFEAVLDGQGGWVRSGDLGCFGPKEELIVVGRIKDMMIIRGINHYPQDIELTASCSHPALVRDGAAAFGVEDAAQGERVVVIQEVARGRQVDVAQITGALREAVVQAHGVTPHRIALVRVGTLPRTTSGKVQRGLARSRWQEGALSLWTADV